MEIDSRIFKIATTFRKPHPVLLGFPEGELYLISISSNTYLGFPEDVTLLKPHRLHLVALTEL